MGKLLTYVREVLVVMILGGAVVRWFQNTKAGKIDSFGKFTDMLAGSPARYKPEDLFYALKSGQFNDLEVGDKVTFLQDATQTFIKSGMGDTEATHVRSVFTAIAIALIADITNISIKAQG